MPQTENHFRVIAGTTGNRMPPDEDTATIQTNEKAEDKPTLSAIFYAEEAPLLRFACGLTGRRVLAEEAVQEAFLRLHRHWNEIEHPKAWLYRCVRNLALNEMRDTAREHPTAELPERGGENLLPDEALGRLEACGTLRLLVAELPSVDRQLVELKYNHHLGYAEISRRTGLGIGNVGFRLHHILKKLANELRKTGIESSLG